ncbi:Hypothetical protein SRAE_X000012100 [Strongyloides ratti]|uniref:Uncharacterized protein n=1 Tax=Strongyloides ratti TaxID=34506 RepID=A0A090LLU6_STRRB|nr:Hypothetical protein SRAE_X000012100 [Strongyloides ratti]CEF70790.1 Hypothetical protein SRAE_X000012100 [Strongyloides ratti]
MSSKEIEYSMDDEDNQIPFEETELLKPSLPYCEESDENEKNYNKNLITTYRNHEFSVTKFSKKEQIIYSILLLIDSLTAKNMRIIQLKRLIKEEVEKIKINSMRNYRNETTNFLKKELLYQNNFSMDDEN